MRRIYGCFEWEVLWLSINLERSDNKATKLAVQQIINLRLMLCYLGVPVAGKNFMFGDNESVVKSSSFPHSKLRKRHNALY